MARATSDLTWLRPHLEAGRATLTEGTMTDPASLRRAVAGVSHIVHVAAVIGPNIPNQVYQQVNVAGTRLLLEAALAADIQRFTLISSVSTYGDGIKPDEPVTEETSQRPNNPYGRSKLAQQQLLFAAQAEHGLPVVSIEPPVIYGPRARVGIGQAVSLVNRRLAPLLDFGRGRMNLVYVTDVVGLLEAADADQAAVGHRFLVAGPRLASHREILQTIAASLGVRPLYFPVPLWLTALGLRLTNALLRLRGRDIFFEPDYFYKFSHGPDYRPDKARRLLGWQPQVDIREGLPRTVQWFIDHDLV